MTWLVLSTAQNETMLKMKPEEIKLETKRFLDANKNIIFDRRYSEETKNGFIIWKGHCLSKKPQSRGKGL